MAILYVHIGTTKTGTSAIQRTLYNSQGVLEQQKIVYPDFGLRYEGVSKERNAHFLNEKDDPEGKDYIFAVKEIAGLSKKYEKIILSEESLWGAPKRLHQFAEDMKNLGITMKIIVYFRRQDLYLQSTYAQKVKVSLRKTFEEYLDSHDLYLDYYEHIQQFAELVGKENLMVRVYEKQQFVSQDLLTDFSEQLGIKNRNEFAEAMHANESLAGVYLEVKRLLNRNEAFQHRKNVVADYLREIAKQSGKTASYAKNQYFFYEKQMAFLAEFEESNQKMAREFLGREDGVLFRDEIPVPEKKVNKSKKYRLLKFLTETLHMEKFVIQYGKELDYKSSSQQYTKAECVDVCGEVILIQQQKIEELKGIIEEMNPGYFEEK